MRLFVAVDIDDDTRAQLSVARAAMVSVLATARVPPRVTWVNNESAHVTLRFIGETPESAVNAIELALAADFASPPFDLRWDRVGTFPSSRRPRVVWIGGEPDDRLSALAAAVNARVNPLVGPGESRPFRPHITLGRVKDSGKDVDWPRAISAALWVPTVTRIDHVTLYASRTSPQGASYTPLATARLRN